jgi:hypothetical protein
MMTAEALLAAALRGESPAWPSHVRDTEVCRVAGEQGIAPLLAVTTGIEAWPEDVRAFFRTARRMEAARDAAFRPELIRLLDALAGAGVRALLIKGAHLACTHYPRPWLRPRADTDLLIDEDHRAPAGEVLRAGQYEPVTDYAGELVTHQFGYSRNLGAGLVHYVDLHWRIANPQVFSSTLSFAELDAQSVAVPALGPRARGLSDLHALALACLHLVAHHGGSRRLIWLYDIHLLAGRLDARGCARLEALAARRGLAAVCGRSIAEARSRFGTAVPAGWPEALERLGADEPTTRFMRARPTKFNILRSDLSALPGWRARLRLVREHLFPPPAYIKRTYGVRHRWLVPCAYAWRIVTGAGRWFT